MSASLHGPAHYATKIVGIHECNPARSQETVNALVVGNLGSAVHTAATGEHLLVVAEAASVGARVPLE